MTAVLLLLLCKCTFFRCENLSLSRNPTLTSTAWFLSMHQSLCTACRNSLHLALYTLLNRLECTADTSSSVEEILHSLRASVNVPGRVVSSSMYVWVAYIGCKQLNVNTCTVHEHTSTMFTSKIFSP